MLTAVLYPYVYILGRSAFLGQSRQALEAARSLGLAATRGPCGRWRSPRLARRWPAGGALTIMEALADFGTVDLLGVQALTSAIYRVWYGAFDQDAALQLATVLVGLALTMLAIERVLRGRARYHQALSRGDAVMPVRLRGWRGLAGRAPVRACCSPWCSCSPSPSWWRGRSRRSSTGDVTPASATPSSARSCSAPSPPPRPWSTGTVVAYGQRAQPSRLGRMTARLATIGYAVPGTVVAVAVYVPLVWIDRRLIDAADSAFGTDIGLVFTGSILGLIIAYLVRFHALVVLRRSTRAWVASSPNLDDAARSLGADRTRVLADVHLPLLWPGLTAARSGARRGDEGAAGDRAAPAPRTRHALDHGVGGDEGQSRFETAALPALLIVLVGLFPVILLVRVGRSGEARASARIGS